MGSESNGVWHILTDGAGPGTELRYHKQVRVIARRGGGAMSDITTSKHVGAKVRRTSIGMKSLECTFGVNVFGLLAADAARK